MSTLAVDFRSVVAFVDRFPVLSGIDLQVERGSSVLLTGPNGAGKTSLLRAMAGLLPVERGTAVVLGADIGVDGRSVRRQVGFLGHSSFLYGELTVRENLSFSVRATGVKASSIDEVLSRLALGGRLADVTVDRLSAGQRRRAALATLVARAPELLLLDEPQASLDAESRSVLAAIVDEARAQGRTVIFSSHEQDFGGIPVDRRVAIIGGAVDAGLGVEASVVG